MVSVIEQGCPRGRLYVGRGYYIDGRSEGTCDRRIWRNRLVPSGTVTGRGLAVSAFMVESNDLRVA